MNKNSSFFREGFHILWKNFLKIFLYNLLLLLCLAVLVILVLAGTLIITKTGAMGGNFTTGVITVALAGTILVLFFPALITGYQYFFVKLAREEGAPLKPSLPVSGISGVWYLPITLHRQSFTQGFSSSSYPYL